MVMQYKASISKQPMVVSSFHFAYDAVLCEFGTQQIRQSPQSSMAACAYASKDGRIKELMTFVFWNRMVAVTFVNGCRFTKIT